MVAGPPGAGKSTVTERLLALLDPVPALLDKDTVYGGFVAATLAAAGPSAGRARRRLVRRARQGARVRRARRRDPGDPRARLPGARDRPVHHGDPRRDALGASGWTSSAGRPSGWSGSRTDAATLRRRLLARGSPRDTGKLADFDAFLARMRPDDPPPVPHLAVDNRDGAPDVTAQLRAALGTGLG